MTDNFWVVTFLTRDASHQREQNKFNIIHIFMKRMVYKNSVNNSCLTLRVGILLLAFIFSFPVIYSQTDSTQNQSKKDTTRIDLGNKELQIIGDTDKKNKEIKLKDKDKDESSDSGEKKSWKSGGFKGHWAGLEFGLNNYLNKDHSMSLSGDDEFMSLNTGRSINFNLNFVQHSFGIVGNCFGLVTGMGLEFYNYFFEHNNSIQMDPDGVIRNKDYSALTPPIDLDKSKLTITYLTVPVLFEFQFPGQLSNSHRLRISFGVIGGLKLGSHTKVVYYQNNNKEKRKEKDDFNINAFRYGFTARVGYKHLNIFSDFYPVTLFEKGKGPVLYPFSIGIAFISI